MITPDAHAPAALEAQLRQLSAVLEHLGAVRLELTPAAATFWGGDARAVYDRAVAELTARLDSTIEVIELARHNSALALAEAVRHG